MQHRWESTYCSLQDEWRVNQIIVNLDSLDAHNQLKSKGMLRRVSSNDGQALQMASVFHHYIRKRFGLFLVLSCCYDDIQIFVVKY